MTNGEKLKEVFKISQVDEGELYAFAWLPNHDAAEISIDWWNAEYKEPTTKNDLGVDAISRIETIDYLCKHCPDDGECFKDCDEIKHLRQMPSVTLQEPRLFKWCETCKEYDQEKHCCHRYSKVIRDTVAEIEQEPILDRVRAEIDKARFIDKDTRICKNALASGLEVAMQIIDKYKGESEE